jgi:hypothetical protein
MCLSEVSVQEGCVSLFPVHRAVCTVQGSNRTAVRFFCLPTSCTPLHSNVVSDRRIKYEASDSVRRSGGTRPGPGVPSQGKGLLDRLR